MNTTLAGTWVPNPGVVYKGLFTPSKQLDEILFYIKPKFKYIDEYFIMPELTAQGNVHLHFKVTFNSKHSYVTFYRSTLPTMKRLGFVVIKKVFDDAGWNDYMLKDAELACQLFPDNAFKDESGTIIGIRFAYPSKKKGSNIDVIPL